MTAPLVPPEVNLRGLPWMRLDTGRLLDSDLFALSTGAEFKAAVALWCKSWAQIPAGSLPIDDRILAGLSGAGGQWRRLKPMALRGWVECDDGRLYHPVVAEQALAAWAERQEYRAEIDGQNQRKQKERAERAAMFERLKAAGHDLPWNTPTGKLRDLSRNLPRDDDEAGHGDSHGLDGTGRDGTGVKSSSSETYASTGGSEGSAALARALVEVDSNRFAECSDAHPDLVAAAAEGITPAELVMVAKAKPGKGIAYLVETARGKRRDAAERAGNGSTAAPAVSVDPEVMAMREAENARDAEVLKAENDFRLGVITDAAERDRRIEAARATFRDRYPHRRPPPDQPAAEARA